MTNPLSHRSGSAYPAYDRVDALERAEDGSLRIYRRRGPFGLLRRQEVFHPAGEWLSVIWHPNGRCQVTTRAGRDAYLSSRRIQERADA